MSDDTLPAGHKYVHLVRVGPLWFRMPGRIAKALESRFLRKRYAKMEALGVETSLELGPPYVGDRFKVTSKPCPLVSIWRQAPERQP